MSVRVTVTAGLAAAVAERYPHERPKDGSPCETDFWAGPLAAALLGFRDFASLPYPDVPAVRVYFSADPVFGPVVFTGVLVSPDEVEIVAFESDPDYWDLVDGDPDDE